MQKNRSLLTRSKASCKSFLIALKRNRASQRFNLLSWLMFISLLFSQCSKKETKDVIPLEKAGASQTANALIAKTKLSNLEKWNKYIYTIENGQIKDATGQYVSKSTQVQSADGVERPIRPKYKFGAGTNYYPEDPEGGAGGGPVAGAQVFSNFVSSVGELPYSASDNPNGYIWDLKIVRDDLSEPEGIHWGRWNEMYKIYKRIDVDLNKGAGGRYFWLCFIRNPKHLVLTPEPRNLTVEEVRGPVTGITASARRVGGSLDDIFSYPYKMFVLACWKPTFGAINEHYGAVDLNDGAGGKYIYAFHSKANSLGAPFKEVGVLYGNSESIQPPAGWERDNQDLNEGAGGDYIYFCFKR